MSELVYQHLFDPSDEVLSWDRVPLNTWRIICESYFFKVSDSFGFLDVIEESDLFPENLSFFQSWDLNEIDLVEVGKYIFTRFELNEVCKNKILDFDFSTHVFNGQYYEFDQLFFFSKEVAVGYYLGHSSVIHLYEYPDRDFILQSLDLEIQKYFFTKEEIIRLHEIRFK